MKALTVLLALFFSCSSIFAQTANGEYGSQFDRGMKAYKDSRYEEAIERFKRATEIDPRQMDAHLYLASSYAASFIPGVNTNENIHLATAAIDQYKSVLELNPARDIKVESLKQIATIDLSFKQWDDARNYYQMASDQAPNDPENYYGIGVIDWAQSYRARAEARERLKMRQTQHLSSKNPVQKKVCAELRSKNSSAVEDAISKLNKAIELRPDYDDAMIYLNLVYRERVDLECDDPKAQEKDLKTADEWIDKTMAAKKARLDQPPVSESEPNRDDPSALRRSLLLPLPPPPPPPPPPSPR